MNRELTVGDKVTFREHAYPALRDAYPFLPPLCDWEDSDDEITIEATGKICGRRVLRLRLAPDAKMAFGEADRLGVWSGAVKLDDRKRWNKLRKKIEAMKRARRKKPRRQKPGPRSVGATAGGTGCQSALDSTHDRQEVRPGPSQDSQNASHQRQARRKPACVFAGASG